MGTTRRHTAMPFETGSICSDIFAQIVNYRTKHGVVPTREVVMRVAKSSSKWISSEAS